MLPLPLQLEFDHEPLCTFPAGPLLLQVENFLDVQIAAAAEVPGQKCSNIERTPGQSRAALIPRRAQDLIRNPGRSRGFPEGIEPQESNCQLRGRDKIVKL